MLGDWNLVPSENDAFHDFQLVAASDPVTQRLLPTRWEGQRCIDYAYCSQSLEVSRAKLLTDVYGDHRALLFTIHSSL